jgi:hypothetical protein
MKIKFTKTFTFIVCIGSMAAATAAIAATDFVPGQMLSAAERSALKPQGSVTIGKLPLTIVKASTADSPNTVVINSVGAVGISKNELLISNVPTSKVKAVLQSMSVSSVATVYYDHMDISSLRFASLQAAVSARDALSPVLPQATFDVPVRYSAPTAK